MTAMGADGLHPRRREDASNVTAAPTMVNDGLERIEAGGIEGRVVLAS